MALNREPIFVALFELLKGVKTTDAVGKVVPLKDYSRRLKHWNDVDAAAQPCLFQAQGNEFHSTVKPGLTDLVKLSAKVYLYVRSPEPQVPGTVLNPILDQLQALFPSGKTSNPGSGKQTLGGLVEHAMIVGDILTFEGTLGDQEVAIVPLELLVVA